MQVGGVLSCAISHRVCLLRSWHIRNVKKHTHPFTREKDLAEVSNATFETWGYAHFA